MPFASRVRQCRCQGGSMSDYLRRGLVVWLSFAIVLSACQSGGVRATASPVLTAPPSPVSEADRPSTSTNPPTATPSPMPTGEPPTTPPQAFSPAPMTPAASVSELPTVRVVDRFLDWSTISRPMARPSSQFDFDGQSLVFWTYQTADNRRAVSLAIESHGTVRPLYRVPVEPPWQVEQVQVDSTHVAWLEVGWGDDPRVFRLWVYDLADDMSRLITETQPSPQPHVPALALDGNWLVVRALGTDGNTCLYAFDLSSSAGLEAFCSPSPDALYGDPYLRGPTLTYVVEDRRQGCSFIQQADLSTGQTASLRALSCQVGLRAAGDDSLLVWPEKVLSQETGEVAEVRLRGWDRQGQVYDLGDEKTSYYQVCDGRAYWLALIDRSGAQTREIRAWTPGEPIAVLYRAAPEEYILGPVCRASWIVFINPVSGEIFGATMSHALGANDPLAGRP